MKIGEILYAAIKPDDTIMGNTECIILHQDEEMTKEEGKMFAEFNGIKPEEVKVIKVRIMPEDQLQTVVELMEMLGA